MIADSQGEQTTEQESCRGRFGTAVMPALSVAESAEKLPGPYPTAKSTVEPASRWTMELNAGFATSESTLPSSPTWK